MSLRNRLHEDAVLNNCVRPYLLPRHSPARLSLVDPWARALYTVLYILRQLMHKIPSNGPLASCSQLASFRSRWPMQRGTVPCAYRRLLQVIPMQAAHRARPPPAVPPAHLTPGGRAPNGAGRAWDSGAWKSTPASAGAPLRRPSTHVRQIGTEFFRRPWGC
jgi:hypothetical protein